MTDATKKYLAAEKAFIAMTNLKVGSKVRIIAACKDHQHGWGTIWHNDMSDLVNDGEEYVVDNITTNGTGIILDCMWSFPFFALEVIDESKIRVSSDYHAIINDDGSIQVGCQSIQYEDLKKVYEAATKKYREDVDGDIFEEDVITKAPVKKKAPAKPRKRA